MNPNRFLHLGHAWALAYILIMALGLTGVTCSLTGCGATTAPVGPAGVPPSATVSTVDSNIENALPLIRTGAAVATGVVLNFSVKQDSTRTRLANEMYSSANAIYTLTGGTLPTVSRLQSTLAAWGDSKDAQYATYTSAVAGLYASYYPQLIAKGGADAKTSSDLLSAIAGGVEDATQAYVTTPAPTVTP